MENAFTGQKFHKKLKIVSAIVAAIFLITMLGAFKYQAMGYVKLVILACGFFGYLGIISMALNYMVNEGEEQLVWLYSNRESRDEDMELEWKSLTAIYSLCAPVSNMLPQETESYQLLNAAFICKNLQKQDVDDLAMNAVKE